MLFDDDKTDRMLAEGRYRGCKNSIFYNINAFPYNFISSVSDK